MNPQEMTGLELLRAVVGGQLPPPSMTETVPMTFVEVDFGCVKMSACHLNPFGGVHGGSAAIVLDSVTGCAVHSALEAAVGYGTIDLQVKMLRPVPHRPVDKHGACLPDLRRGAPAGKSPTRSWSPRRRALACPFAVDRRKYQLQSGRFTAAQQSREYQASALAPNRSNKGRYVCPVLYS